MYARPLNAAAIGVPGAALAVSGAPFLAVLGTIVAVTTLVAAGLAVRTLVLTAVRH
ncbi:hypothetical protein G6045_29195 [Streptomyces sp. YC504]|uniref:Uncharacterized protein n=1 Tax=Streptomyces mesophilus TaxID=1775132 RepID=A0A6G4XSX1_9ACTN|nr:hypothetical protein [Streptomyces mesophilus]NGO79701.1 hypothetical protein [Streptomyces mesophilus]